LGLMGFSLEANAGCIYHKYGEFQPVWPQNHAFWRKTRPVPP